jgi:hypothetical protein
MAVRIEAEPIVKASRGQSDVYLHIVEYWLRQVVGLVLALPCAQPLLQCDSLSKSESDIDEQVSICGGIRGASHPNLVS